jgi:two-component system OmpR family sensor kinase
MLAIVNNLLMLTRLQARGVADEAVDLVALLRQSADALAARAERRRLPICLELPEPRDGRDARLVVRGDGTWLRRALDNLLDNALSFAAAPPGAQGAAPPQITVRLFSDGQQAHKQAQIEVINEGPGIAPEVRGRLFQRFVTTRRDTGGSGLGLAIVAAVAEQHGGSVELIEPGPPRTRFRLSLPLAG